MGCSQWPAQLRQACWEAVRMHASNTLQYSDAYGMCTQMAVHGAAMAQLGYDLKWLLKESKILIRSRVIKTSSMFAPEPSQPPEETPPPDVCCQALEPPCCYTPCGSPH